MDDRNLVDLAVKLFEIQAVKFGNYKIKSGITSPIYFDLRVIVSHPEVLETISNLLLQLMKSEVQCDHLCGVPYTALPIATVMSVKSKIPMLIRRKEAKDYGTKKLIEGQFNNGDKCVIIEDVITSGSSVFETTSDLRKQGLEVSFAYVILDRQQGGRDNLLKQNIKVKSLFNLRQFLDILLKEEKIEKGIVEQVENYLKTNQTPIPVDAKKYTDRLKMSFEQRCELVENDVTKRLFKLMLAKRSNLCIAADYTTTNEIIDLFNVVGPHICIFKIHIDIVKDYTSNFIETLLALAKKYDVMLMEDRKYADIGNTVALQYSNRIYDVAQWADLITVHSISGPGILKGIQSIFDDKPKGVFIIAEMSSEGNLITPQYAEASVKMADDAPNLVTGFVCQNKDIIKNPGFIQLTPGVKLIASSDESRDNLGQNYCSPEEAVIKKGADIAVVGRGIMHSKDPEATTILYKSTLWQSYEQRLK